MSDCDLCKAEKKTKWHYEDDRWWIADCLTCGTPMVVYKRHTMTVPLTFVSHILDVIERKFGRVETRINQRKIKDHLHWHLI